MKANVAPLEDVRHIVGREAYIKEIKRLLFLDIPKYDVKEAVRNKHPRLTLEAFEELFTEAYTTLHIE